VFGFLLAVIFFVIAARSTLRRGLTVLLASILLVPNSLYLPGSSILTVQRTTAVALLINLIVRIRRREISKDVFAVTPVHAMFMVMLAVTFVVGVVLAQPTVSVTDSSHIWANYFGEFVVFIIVLATIRAINDTMFVARMLAVVLLITAGFAAIEHATGNSYARFFFRGSTQDLSGPASVLEHRGSQVRVRVASNYSIDYAWVVASLVPLFLVAALSRFRRWYVVGAGLFMVLLAVYWTRSRSMAIPLVVGMLVLAVLGRTRRVVIASLITVVVMAVTVLSVANVASALSASADVGSIQVRFSRIPAIAAVAAQHAWSGLGFTGVADLGFQAVDSSYLLLYGDIGVLGLTVVGLLYITGVAVAARAIRTQDPRERLIGTAAMLGALALVGAGFAYDSTTQLDDQYLLWTLVALGIVAAERSVGAPRWLAMPSPLRVGAVALSCAVGFLISVAAPSHVAATFTFSTLPPQTELQSDPVMTGRILIRSVCNLADAPNFDRDGVSMSCEDPNDGLSPRAIEAGQTAGGPGQGELRIQARDMQTGLAVLTDFSRAVRSVRQLHGVQLHMTTPTRHGRPTPWRTAPLWLPLIVGMAAVLLPRRRRRDQPVNFPSTSG
jgi:hypothetical protein